LVAKSLSGISEEKDIIVPLPNENIILQFLNDSMIKQLQRRKRGGRGRNAERQEEQDYDDEEEEDYEVEDEGEHAEFAVAANPNEQNQQTYIVFATMVCIVSAIQDLYKSQMKVVRQEVKVEIEMFMH
jgi:hypothetical protein